MRLLRFYHAVALAPDQLCVLTEKTSHHMATVLRLISGDRCHLFDGCGTEALCEIVSLTKKCVTVKVLQMINPKTQPTLHTHLAQALCKGDKMEWIIQKACELGVSEITPLITEFSDVRLDEKRLAKKTARWRDIAISACEQCGRAKLPVIHSPQPIKAFITDNTHPLKLLFTPTATQPLRTLQTADRSFCLLIGPEGGLSGQEIKHAHDQGFMAFSLGSRILRTETAAIASLSIVHALFDTIAP
jgi:16S rRNA (uracil1498-N3)-methyltransferase